MIPNLFEPDDSPNRNLGPPRRTNAAAPAVEPDVPEPGPIRTVSQVNSMIQQALAVQLPPVLLVQGEISNFKVYSKGHAFFTLKDSASELPCVLWRDALARLGFSPRDGLAVVAQGTIRIYESQGKVQLYVNRLRPRGEGELELAFRRLYEKLRDQGLFDTQRKRPLPKLPRHVVIITSPTGDVLQDVLTTAYRRFPGLHTMLLPVQVQGAVAAGQIAQAIEMVNRYAARIGGVDLILLVRGGGSLEDLWAFNEEVVARAIAASRIPIATGIGHEPDTTIADLVADLRGSTPTAVTELSIPDVRVFRDQLASYRELIQMYASRLLAEKNHLLTLLRSRVVDGLRRALAINQRRTEQLAGQVRRIEPRHAVAQGWRRLEDAQRRLSEILLRRVKEALAGLNTTAGRMRAASPRWRFVEFFARLKPMETALPAAAAGRLERARLQLSNLANRLDLASPHRVLERGFSITMDEHGAIISRVRQAISGRRVTTRLSDGSFQSVVENPADA